MKRYFQVFIILAALILIGLASARLFAEKQVIRTPVAVTPAAKADQEQQPTGEKAYPVTLIIPRLGIHATIEQVGMDAKGNMDVPKQNEDVAWFALGYLPGSNGNAVIAGHLDTKTGAPAVFYHLGALDRGDIIRVETDNGDQLEFRVTGKAVYPSQDFPLVTVFGPAARPRLNLITCEGTYNIAQHNYSHRTVVFSELSS
jgi:LPXTG-site transpeptidase (sortase) family protein